MRREENRFIKGPIDGLIIIVSLTDVSVLATVAVKDAAQLTGDRVDQTLVLRVRLTLNTAVTA